MQLSESIGRFTDIVNLSVDFADILYLSVYLRKESSIRLKPNIVVKLIFMIHRNFNLLLLLFLITSFTGFAQNNTKEIQLQDIYKYYRFFPRGSENLKSMNNGACYTIMHRGSKIQKFEYETGEFIETIFDLSRVEDFPLHGFFDYSFSSDEKKILLAANRNSIYRHSFTADNYIYDIEKDKLYPLSKNGSQKLATFSPDGKYVAFVRENNLFLIDLIRGIEKQITTDGKRNYIINGAPDWVYEEEFAFSKGFEWSPDSKRIAFYRFDEERVHQFNMTLYEDLYPEWYQFKYPKAGEDNSIVSIHIYSLETEKNTPVDIGEEIDQYIPRIKWTNNPEVLSVWRLNRLQNKLDVLHANVLNGKSQTVYTEKEDKYISEPTDDMINYLANGEEFILKSEKDNWMQLYRYNFRTGKYYPITNGEFDVAEILGIDDKNKLIYYSASERNAWDLEVYKIGFDGKGKKLLTKNKGWNEAEFNTDFSYFINTWSDINTPNIISLHSNSGKEIRILQDNKALAGSLRQYGFTEAEIFNLETEKGIQLNAYMIKPPDFDPKKKYPLFMFVYGGPESQEVINDYNPFYLPWFEMLAQKGYIVACVDNRGTDSRGEDFRKATYKQLGKLETIDQLDAIKYLSTKSYIDESRIGMFGWSYGGYLSLSCLFKGQGLLKMAIAVAPVTNWRYYDNIYTERFMQKPQDNPEGYDENSPINFTGEMQGELLLIHGMGDDNVHFQNSVELMKALVESNKQFESQFYPNKNHGIYGGNTTFHLFTRMTKFIEENL